MAINSGQIQQSSPFERLLGAAQGVTGVINNIGELQKKSMERKLAEEASDPNSDLSKQTRMEYSKATGSPIADSISAMRLKETYGPLSAYALQQSKFGQDKELLGLKGKQDKEIALLKSANSTKNRLPPDKILAVNQGNEIPKQLQDIKLTLSANQDLFGPVAGRIASINPYNERAQTADAQMRAASQSFGRLMEGGVLRKEDEEKYRKMFPNLSDTPEVAKNKLQIVERLLANKQGSDIRALRSSGFNTEGLDQNLPIPGTPGILANQSNQSNAIAGGAIKSGHVEDGFMFTGGDPSDPSAWVKVK